MRVVIPFDATNPKSRLADVLDPAERREFSEAMLRDVIDTVEAVGNTPEVVSTAPIDLDVPTIVDDRRLTPLINEMIDTGTPIAVVMADLALATPDTLRRLFSADGDVVIAPGRAAGTNALVVRDQTFRVDYHGASYRDHLERARTVGASVREIDSCRLSTDVDDPGDLLEVLVHGDGEAAAWLRAAGFRVDTEQGDPRAVR